MGIYKIDNVSKEELECRQMRRNDIRSWMITLAEIAAMAGVVWLVIWAWNWLGI